MHILMLSWEFPPLVVGGIARHVYDLSLALAKQDIEVTVLTVGDGKAPAMECLESGVTVHRVQHNNPSPLDLIEQIMQLNLNLMERATALTSAGLRFDMVHAHDWVTAYAGKALKHALGLPLFATIHATEWGRNNGLHNELQRYISGAEWWLCYEAWRVICCSLYMGGELGRVFQLPRDKIRVIPNGVFSESFASGPVPPGFRERYAARDEKIILHIGRLVREKGLDVLIDAMPRILERHPRTKLIIAGRGGHELSLHERARMLGIYHRVYFSGYVDDTARNYLYKIADAAVFPSLYEPFGIVALEAMAAGAPPIVSDTGGISEVVTHGVNGLKAQTGNSSSLAENILWMLEHPEETSQMRAKARLDVDRLYNWERIAAETSRVYREVLDKNFIATIGQPSPSMQKEPAMAAEGRYARTMG